ncbi:hypothetical protein J7L36_00855 [bacterium]|nr:hypothetical protein [bacterium]
MPKIRVIYLRTNGEIEFKTKKYGMEPKIRIGEKEIEFNSKHIFKRIPKFLKIFPLWGFSKAYIVVREGDSEPISIDELPKVTKEKIEEWAKSKLIRVLGLDLPRETPLLAYIWTILLIVILILQILMLRGVRIF